MPSPAAIRTHDDTRREYVLLPGWRGHDVALFADGSYAEWTPDDDH